MKTQSFKLDAIICFDSTFIYRLDNVLSQYNNL